MPRRRSAFTLIELLTVMAIIAVLSAILLPSVVQSQEQARLQTCKNNLKQLGLAMHNYHDVYNSFPPGWIAKTRDADVGPLNGWQTALLPFVDQLAIYNGIDFDDIAANDRKLFETVIPTYRCPSDPMVDLNPLRGRYATSNYSGNAGSERLPGSVDTPEKLNGIFWWNSSARIANIIDGTSNTFAIGERSITSAAGIWMGLTANRNENDAVSDCNHETRLNASLASFSSKHDGGAHFLMCDGAVRFIPSDIDSHPEWGTYQKLAARDDRQAVNF